MATTVTRGEFGQIIFGEGVIFDRAKFIVKAAQAKGLLDKPFDDTVYNCRSNKFFGEMLNADMYDVAPGAALVQYRYLYLHKYGKNIRKEYYLVKRDKNGKITVQDREIDKPRIMKLAKSDLPVGGVIAAITGRKMAKIKVSPLEKKVGYKALTRDEDGNLISVWDGSKWEIGKTRIESASPDFNGGFYCYRSLEKCLSAAYESDVFGDCRNHDNLVIAEVITSGRAFKHDSEYGTKICTSRMKVVQILGELTDFNINQAA